MILTGLPGVGKTALSLRLGHLLRPVFPDSQLSVHLGGARGPEGAPDVMLADLLLALGLAGSSIPESTGARAAMFRSLLSGRRVLVLLDDARDEAQIRALLPGTAACAVLVTSRSRLSAVAGAHLIDVSPLDEDESRALLHRIAGVQRFTSYPEATRQVLAGCAGLPLALRVSGTKLASRPHLCVRQLADRLDGGAVRRLTAKTSTGSLSEFERILVESAIRMDSWTRSYQVELDGIAVGAA